MIGLVFAAIGTGDIAMNIPDKKAEKTFTDYEREKKQFGLDGLDDAVRSYEGREHKEMLKELEEYKPEENKLNFKN